mmetsp:Transcript_290/g.358  ORF Transcript_290/g.358 Transcript_290/m.358 type:complete len:669 (+) Transcript_290:101-2107(+)
MEEVNKFRDLISDSKTSNLVRNPVHGHSFYRASLVYPNACSICDHTVLVFGSPCRCLICGIVAHRACVSRTYSNHQLALCASFQVNNKVSKEQQRQNMDERKTGDQTYHDSQQTTKSIKLNHLNDVYDEGEVTTTTTTGPTTILEEESNNSDNELRQTQAEQEEEQETRMEEEEEEDKEVSISDPNYRMKQVHRATSLGGSALLGTVVGSMIGGVSIIGAPPLLGAIAGTMFGKAAFAFTGATLGYRRQRMKQLELLLEIPTEDNIPKYWNDKTLEICNSNSLIMSLISSSYTGKDEDIQIAIKDCNLEEKVNLFISKTLLNPQTLPGIIFEKLIQIYKNKYNILLIHNNNEDVNNSNHSLLNENNEFNKISNTKGSTEGGAEETENNVNNNDNDDGKVSIVEHAIETIIYEDNGEVEKNDGNNKVDERSYNHNHGAEDGGDDDDDDENENDKVSPVLDCIGLLLEIVKAVFQYHPILGEEDVTIQMAVNAVDRLVFGEIYSFVFQYLKQIHHQEDSKLTLSLSPTSSSSPSPSLMEAPRSLIRQSPSWNNLYVSDDAIRALGCITMARTASDKLSCITRFVDCVSNDAFHNTVRTNVGGNGSGGGGGGGGGGGKRWGEDIVLPFKGIVKPAWTKEREEVNQVPPQTKTNKQHNSKTKTSSSARRTSK